MKSFNKIHWFFRVLFIFSSIIFLWLMINYGLPKLLPTKNVSNSEVFGLQIQNQIWEGTIRIVGDIITPMGTTIYIKPGTKVLVEIRGDKSNFDFLYWHLKSGVNTSSYYHGVNRGEPFWDEREKIQIHLAKLNALGTKEQPIEIRSAAQSGSPYDFNVISINSGILAHVIASDYRRFEISDRVTIRDSIFRNIGECAICISRRYKYLGNSTIISNTFENAFRESIWIDGASPRITDNLFINLVGAGIRIDSKRQASPIISYNSFEMPQNLALDILSGGEINHGVVSFNNFSGDSQIKLSCDSNIKFSQNILLSLISFAGTGCGGEFSFGPNYFGTPDVKTIFMEKITNKDKNFTISIPNILITPPKEAGRRI